MKRSIYIFAVLILSFSFLTGNKAQAYAWWCSSYPQLAKEYPSYCPPSVAPPGISFTASTVNGYGSQTIYVGEAVTYTWQAYNATSVSSYYTVDSSSTQYGWVANSLSGSAVGVTAASQVGHTYYVHVVAYGPGGSAPMEMSFPVAASPPTAAANHLYSCSNPQYGTAQLSLSNFEPVNALDYDTGTRVTENMYSSLSFQASAASGLTVSLAGVSYIYLGEDDYTDGAEGFELPPSFQSGASTGSIQVCPYDCYTFSCSKIY